MPALPEPIKGLRELAYNLWWTWNPSAQDLWEEISPALWKRFRGNPVKLLLEVDPARLQALAQDASFVDRCQTVARAYREYLASRPSAEPQVAYFSMEFGFHESLPIYSGGLGILAGDHVKSASDLGLLLVGVGMFFHQGYFRQELSPEGQQREAYDDLLFTELPLVPAKDQEGRVLKVAVEFPGRTVFVTAFQVKVGSVAVYLMSTNLPENSPEDRLLTARLYAPGQEIRIEQELILGIGGVRVLRALGLAPAVWHMNEGHAAFIGLERIREKVAAGAPFALALEAVAAGSIFTTHTPVPAGHDAFPIDLIDRYLAGWWDKLGISRDEFLALGLEPKNGALVFSMSHLALSLTRRANGVSKLHGEVSRQMFQHLWPGLEAEEVPIGHITNGIHTWSFLHPELLSFFEHHFPVGWKENLASENLWPAEKLPEQELWQLRNQLRAELVADVRARLYEQRRRNGETPDRRRAAERVLDPTALTIGFARRFATYKRALLLFKDPERLKRILRGSYPVQIVFAGKAHPKDDPGKAFIKDLVARIREAGLDDKIVLLENYDLRMARKLVQGVDVWLNTPRRPMEASGTSGMKAALNGALNFSILDGWWAEAYNSRNGWAIGDERTYASEEAQDTADAESLYDTLENEILPLFYARAADGTPLGWINMVRESIRSIGPFFSASRMVEDYRQKYYLPAARYVADLEAAGPGGLGEAGNLAKLRQLADWKRQVRSRWQDVRVTVEAPGDTVSNGHGIELRAFVFTAGLPDETFQAEMVVRRGGGFLEVYPLVAKGREGDTLVFTGRYQPSRPGSYVYGVRVVALHPALSNPREVAFVRWA